MNRYFRLLKKNFTMELSSEMAYKTNFFIKSLSLIIGDLVGPLVILLIYTTTSGIPGWSLYEFILFQGILTLIFGLGHALLIVMPFKVIENIREGTFDKILIKPFNPLFYLTFTATDVEGFAEVLAGIGLIIFAMLKLNLTLSFLNIVAFLILIILGFLFQYAIMVFISSISFLVVKSYALFDIFFRLMDFAKYPLTIYSFGAQFMLTFLFPVAVSAYYPASFLLGKMPFYTLLFVGIPVLAFLSLAILLWGLAIKKYTSAGG